MLRTQRAFGLAMTLLLAGAVQHAHAQNQVPIPGTKKDLVARIVAAQQQSIDEVGRGIAATTAQQVFQAAVEVIGRLPEARQQTVGKAVEEDVQKFHGEIEPLLKSSAGKVAPSAIGDLLEQKMTDDELKQLATWLESPVSRKYRQLSGEIESALGQQIVADSRPSVEPKLKALEATIRSRLEAAGASTPGAAKPPAKKK